MNNETAVAQAQQTSVSGEDESWPFGAQPGQPQMQGQPPGVCSVPSWEKSKAETGKAVPSAQANPVSEQVLQLLSRSRHPVDRTT